MPGPAPSHPVPGTVIAERYEMGELLGRGGMAEVYAGTDRRLGRPVAIKLLLPEMAAQPDFRTRFEAEARTAASLAHPNAVGVYDTGEHDAVPYIVMERLPGETLADRIAAGPVDPMWLGKRAAEVLDALGAAHASGLVHRDVKPANILIAADGRAKVADFGIAKSLEAGRSDLTQTGQLLGTPAYLAPERLDGAPATPRSDLWALGVVLYEALAGTRPYTGETALGIARAVASGAHRPLAELRPDLDPAVVAAVERAMDPDPARRFATAAEMSSGLAGASLVAADTTVDLAPAGHTMVLDGPPLDRTAVGGPGDPGPAVAADVPGGGRGADPRRRQVVAWILAGGLLLLLLVVLLLSQVGGDGSSSVSSGASTTVATRAAPTTVSPTAALARQLRDEAARLDGQGAVAGGVATGLRSVADRVERGGGGPEATTLLATVAALDRAGQLPDATAAEVGAILRRVPGIDPSVANAVTPTTRAPAPSGDSGKGGGKGKDD